MISLIRKFKTLIDESGMKMPGIAARLSFYLFLLFHSAKFRAIGLSPTQSHSIEDSENHLLKSCIFMVLVIPNS
jgi:hypothetical protein